MAKDYWFSPTQHGSIRTPVVRAYYDENEKEWRQETHYVFDSREERPESAYLHYGGPDVPERELRDSLNDRHKQRYYFRKVTGKQAKQFLERERSEKAEDERQATVDARRPVDPERGEKPIGHSMYHSQEDANRSAMWARAVGDWPVVVKKSDTDVSVYQYRKKPDFTSDSEIYSAHWNVSQADAMRQWNKDNGQVFSEQSIREAENAPSPSNPEHHHGGGYKSHHNPEKSLSSPRNRQPKSRLRVRR